MAFKGKAALLEIWGMWSTPSLPLLANSLWPGVVISVRVLSMSLIDWFKNYLYSSPVRWSCRIHLLHLCRVVRPLKKNGCPVFDTKQSDGESPVMLEVYGKQNNLSLLLLPGPLWLGVVSPARVLSMGQIEQTMCANK